MTELSCLVNLQSQCQSRPSLFFLNMLHDKIRAVKFMQVVRMLNIIATITCTLRSFEFLYGRIWYSKSIACHSKSCSTVQENRYKELASYQGWDVVSIILEDHSRVRHKVLSNKTRLIQKIKRTILSYHNTVIGHNINPQALGLARYEFQTIY